MLTTVSAALVHEEDPTQHLIYYISHMLCDAETHYTNIEKLALALVSATRKLCPYFQVYQITTISTYPLQESLAAPYISYRMTK